jgi:glutamate 5-kinase
MTVVAKLGSAIVAEDDGELRSAVLDSVCEQVAALNRSGENVALVTSGAIARGRRVMELSARPEAVDELQAASAVGQGSLFRAYEERLTRHDVRAAQVLLTAFDVSARTQYLNARGTLRRLLAWRVVPVVNENDTTATDEITFGDNDFLSAQVAILLEARLLVLLTDTAGLHTADPRTASGAELIEEVTDFAQLERYEIGDRSSEFGLGGMQSKVRAAEMASAAGIPVVVCDGTAPGTLSAAAAGKPVGTRFAAHPERTPSFKLWLRYAKPARGRVVVDDGAARVLRERGSSLLPVGITAVEGTFAAGDAVEVATDGDLVGKGIVNYSAAELGRIKGMKSAEVRELMPHASEEAVHRDYFVLT